MVHGKAPHPPMGRDEKAGKSYFVHRHALQAIHMPMRRNQILMRNLVDRKAVAFLLVVEIEHVNVCLYTKYQI